MQKNIEKKKQNIVCEKENAEEKGKINELINFNKRSNNVFVSIIVPVFNVERYLSECLDSIINQSLKNLEVICINDGSTDNSKDILLKYAKRDARVKIVNKENSGYGHSMNIGLDMAQGEYIGIVESDDYIDEHMYEELYDTAKKYDADIVKGDYYKLWGEGANKKLAYQRLNSKNSCYGTIIDPSSCIDIFQFNTTWSGIYKKEFINKYGIRHQETPGASYQDIGFWFKTTCSASKIYYINKPYYYYRQDNINSSIHSKDKVYFGSGEYREIYNYLKKNQFLYDRFIGIYHARKYYNFIYTYRRIDDRFKKEFILHFSEEFRKAREKNELKKELFEESDYNELQEIIENPILYYNKNTAIPIVFSADDNYAPYLGITIQSLINNSDKNNFYRILIFNESLNEEYKQILTNLATNNTFIEIVDVEKYIDSSNLYETRHFTKAMYYRLIIPRILKNNKKVIYLDCDILIMKDIAELFNVSLGDNVLGVVRNLCNIFTKKYVINTLNLSSDTYFNSGVLVFNCEKYLEYNIDKECFNILKVNKNLNYPDQDILNIACKEKVKYLDDRWNVQWHHLWGDEIGIPLADEFKEEYSKAIESPYILHYTTHIKPWSYPNRKYADRFWDYARQSEFFNDIIKKNLGQNDYKKDKIENVKISIIIPVYNMERYVEVCIKSIQNQTLKEIQIICINDGSTDKSLDILNNLCSQDKRINVISQKNSGAGIARNVGIMRAKGEFIAFMDPDDFYPDKEVLKKLYSLAKENNAMICGGSFSTFNGKDIISKYEGMNADNTINKNGFINYRDYQYDYGFHRFIYNADLIRLNGIFFPEYLRFQDPPFFVKAMITAKRFYGIKDITYVYRMQHKTINWTDEKINALVSGLRDNMIISKNNKLEKLHYITYCRINGEFREIIERGLTNKNNIKLCKLLVEITMAIDNNLLKKYKPTMATSQLIGPLYTAVYGNKKIIINNDGNEQVNLLNNEIKKIKGELEISKRNEYDANHSLNEIRKSTSFKVGRFITFIPRIIREKIMHTNNIN